MNIVGMIGTGMVGTSFAYALMQHGVTNELVLIDADTRRAEGEMMDLNHGMPFVRPMRIIQAALDRIFDQTRNAAYEIIQRKRATYYAIGLGLLSIVEAVLRDQHTVTTVSSPLSGQYGVSDIAIGMPAIVGRQGVEEVLNLPLSESELAAFQSSAQTLKDRLAEIA
jgi:malate/lactate dehydrogenase